MIGFACHVCRTALTAEDSQAGKLLRCPTCLTTLRAPLPVGAEPIAQPPATATAPAPIPSAPSNPSAWSDSEIALDLNQGEVQTSTHLNPPPAPSGGAAANFSSQSADDISRSSGATAVASPSSQRQTGHISKSFPRAAGSRRYGFNCVYCSSRLEATSAMAGQEGNCPTCGNTIIIPILDRHGRLIDPVTKQIIKQDPHPVHAYAAAGERAPALLRTADGQHLICCPRCKATSPIIANNCKACGMPFTMEGTTQEAAGNGNGFCTASLVLGIIGLVAFCAVIPPVLAVIFGIIGYNQVTKSGVEGMKGGKGMAVAGMICGGIGCLFAFGFIFSH